MNTNGMRGGTQRFNFPSTPFSNQASSSHLNQQWSPNHDRSNMLGTDTFFDPNSVNITSGNAVGYDDGFRGQLLAQASADELKRAQNHAYMSLHDDFLKLQGQLSGKDETISTLKALLLQQPVSKGLATSTIEERPMPSCPLAVPLSPAECEKENYEEVKYWTIGEWNEYKSRKPDCGKLEFLTDDDGSKIHKDRLKEMSTEARILFNELYRHRYDPSTWSTRTAVASAFFSNHMRQKFSEFRWCEGDWKVHAFATARYPNWVVDGRDRGRLQREHPSINAGQQKPGKRKAPDDVNEPKRKRKKKTKTPSEDGHIVIDLSVEEYTSATSGVSSKHDKIPTPPSQPESSGPSSPESVVQATTGADNVTATSAAPVIPTIDTASSCSVSNMNNATASSAITVSAVITETATPLGPASDALTESSSNTATATVNNVATPATGIPSATTGALFTDGGDEGLFTGLSIPQPPIEAPVTTTSSEVFENPPQGPSSAGKLMVPSEALTPRNLFATDYMKKNPSTTVKQFAEIWKQVEKENNEILKKYKTLSTQRRKEAAPAKKSRNAK